MLGKPPHLLSTSHCHANVVHIFRTTLGKKVSNLIRVLECLLLVVYRISQITVPFILIFFF